MTPSDTKARDSKPESEWIPVVVTFGSVTVETLQPPEHILRANIKAGQDALRRAKSAIISPGVSIPRKKGVPLYYCSDSHPGLIVRELDGKKSLGRYSGGRFRVVIRALID